MSAVDHERLANGGAITAWVGWFFSHLSAVNEVIQFIVLMIALVSGMYALIYHRKRLEAMK